MTGQQSRDPGYEGYQAFIDEAKLQASKWLDQRLKTMEGEIEEIVARKTERVFSQQPSDAAPRQAHMPTSSGPVSPAPYLDAWWKVLIFAASIVVLTALGATFIGGFTAPSPPPTTAEDERGKPTSETEERVPTDDRGPEVRAIVRDLKGNADALSILLQVSRLPASVRSLSDAYVNTGRLLGGREEMALIDGLTQELLNAAGTTPALKVDGRIRWHEGIPIGRTGPLVLDYLRDEYLPGKGLSIRDAIAAVENELGTGREQTIKFLQRAMVSDYLRRQ